MRVPRSGRQARAIFTLGIAAFLAPSLALGLVPADYHLAAIIRHTTEATEYGKEGHADILVTHAEAALTHAEAAEKANPHTREGIIGKYYLKLDFDELIEYARIILHRADEITFRVLEVDQLCEVEKPSSSNAGCKGTTRSDHGNGFSFTSTCAKSGRPEPESSGRRASDFYWFSPAFVMSLTASKKGFLPFVA